MNYLLPDPIHPHAHGMLWPSPAQSPACGFWVQLPDQSSRTGLLSPLKSWPGDFLASKALRNLAHTGGTFRRQPFGDDLMPFQHPSTEEAGWTFLGLSQCLPFLGTALGTLIQGLSLYSWEPKWSLADSFHLGQRRPEEQNRKSHLTATSLSQVLCRKRRREASLSICVI